MHRFHYALVAAVVVTGFVSIASAADLPRKAPVYQDPVVAYRWTGFYVGGNVGGSWGRSHTDYFLGGVALGSKSQNMNGWLGGIQAGYNAQNGAWLYGVEADIQATSQRGTAAVAGATPDIPCILFDPPAPACTPGTGIAGTPGSLSYEQKLPWFATFRGRLGYIVAPTWLLYATGGLAVGRIKTNTVFVIPTAAAATGFSDTKAGWTIGAGVEWGFAPNWSVKLEYLYLDFGNIDHTFGSIAPFTGSFLTTSHVTDHIARAGINYRFN
jgi:outer membrane immunogenic protein